MPLRPASDLPASPHVITKHTDVSAIYSIREEPSAKEPTDNQHD